MFQIQREKKKQRQQEKQQQQPGSASNAAAGQAVADADAAPSTATSKKKRKKSAAKAGGGGGGTGAEDMVVDAEDAETDGLVGGRGTEGEDRPKRKKKKKKVRACGQFDSVSASEQGHQATVRPSARPSVRPSVHASFLPQKVLCVCGLLLHAGFAPPRGWLSLKVVGLVCSERVESGFAGVRKALHVTFCWTWSTLGGGSLLKTEQASIRVVACMDG